MQTIRHGIASRFIQRGSGCSSQRALQCARPINSKRPIRKPATCVYSVILPSKAEIFINKVSSQYQRFSRSWVAPLVYALLTTAFIAAAAGGIILAATQSNYVLGVVKEAVVEQSKGPILAGSFVVIGLVGGLIALGVYYIYEQYQRNYLRKDKTLHDWANAERIEHLFSQEVIEHLDSMGCKYVLELAAAAADDRNYLIRVWTKRRSGEDSDTVERQARAMNRYLIGFHERVMQAMAS